MEVINSISNIKSESDFTSNEEYKKYLLENYRLILNELSALKDKLDDYKKIQVELLKGINNTSEDNNNNIIMINDNISEDTEISELSEQTKDKPKIKKNTKKSDTVITDAVTVTVAVVAATEEVEVVDDKPKTKKSTKKTAAAAVVAAEEEEVVDDKPKTKKSTKKTAAVAVVAAVEEEVVDKPKKKSNSVTKETSKKSTKKSDSV